MRIFGSTCEVYCPCERLEVDCRDSSLSDGQSSSIFGFSRGSSPVLSSVRFPRLGMGLANMLLGNRCLVAVFNIPDSSRGLRLSSFRYLSHGFGALEQPDI